MSSKFGDINDIFIKPGIPAPTVALLTNITGTGIDLSTCPNNQMFAIQIVGTASGTSAAFTGKIQEASTLTGTYADISGAVFTALTSNTLTTAVLDQINFQRTQPFVRYVGTIAGTTTLVSLDVVIGGMKGQIGN